MPPIIIPVIGIKEISIFAIDSAKSIEIFSFVLLYWKSKKRLSCKIK